MTDKDRALYAGGALCALVVGGAVAKLVLIPADTAFSRPAMHAVTSLGSQDAFGSASALTASVTPPPSPVMAAVLPTDRQEVDKSDPPVQTAQADVTASGSDAGADAPSARDDAASVSNDQDAEPGRADSTWGRTYEAPQPRDGYYTWRRPPPPARREYVQPPRYAYGPPRYEWQPPGRPPPDYPPPWQAGPPPSPEDGEPD